MAVPRDYLHAPPIPVAPRALRLLHYGFGAAATPAYTVLAALARTRGMGIRVRAARMAFAMLLRRRRRLPISHVFSLVFFPMDSTRYFEVDFLWCRWPRESVRQYLDVSSPRLVPLLMMGRDRSMRATLLNPDRRDLEITRGQALAAGVANRCVFWPCTIDALNLPPSSFDVITCASVLEHISDDAAALRRMWLLLRPGGTLLLTVPCAAKASEQFIDRYEYGVLSPGADGFTFWQRFYDEARLQSVVFDVTGEPVHQEVYGERRLGLFRRNADRKRRDPLYPFWREPYMMATEYRSFRSVAELPGEGVVGLELRKP